MINSMPELPRCFRLADIRPHFVNFRRCHSANYHFHGAGIPLLQEPSIDGLQPAFLFFSSLRTVSVLIPNTGAVSRIPLPLRASSIICCFTDGKYPRLVYARIKVRWEQASSWQRKRCLPLVVFSRLTMLSLSQEGHRTAITAMPCSLLPDRGCKTLQLDSSFGKCPSLEHYPGTSHFLVRMSLVGGFLPCLAPNLNRNLN